MRYFIILMFAVLAACNSKTTKDSTVTSEDLVFVGDFSSGLEGPAVDRNGDLYFVNPLRNGSIGKISISENTFEVFIDSLPNGSVGNGIRFAKDGAMYVADYTNHNVLKIDPNTKEVSVFANDTTMNQPNDIAIATNGTLYASDPAWSDGTGNIWKIDTLGVAEVLETNIGTTNGIEVGPGDSILYVGESVQRKIWAYSLTLEGTLSNKRLLIEFSDHGLDGIRTDSVGNLYVTRYGKGVVAVVSPEGKILDEIKLKGLKPSNIAFGGKDGKTCYVTCQDRGYIEQFRAKFPGRSFGMIAK